MFIQISQNLHYNRGEISERVILCLMLITVDALRRSSVLVSAIRLLSSTRSNVHIRTELPAGLFSASNRFISVSKRDYSALSA